MAVVAGNEKAARVKAGGSFRNRLGDDLAWGRQAPAGHPLTRYQIAVTAARKSSMDVSICGASARLSRWRIRRCTDRTGSKTMEVSVWHSYCCTDGAFQATLSCGPRHRHHHGEASDSFAALQHLPGRQGLSSCFVGSLAHADAPPRVHAGLRRSSEATTGSPTPCAGQSTAQPNYDR